MIFNRDILSSVVCNIRTPCDSEEEIGTGIFIVKDNDVFLLTASHVIKNLNCQSYVVLSDLNGLSTKVSLKLLIGDSTFTSHPAADLAKVQINLNSENKAYLHNRCFPYSQIETNKVVLSKDVELTSVGFPLGLGVAGSRFSPLTFRSYVSSPLITLARFDTGTPCDYIILESPSIRGGYSGGPLFDLGYVIHGGVHTSKEHTILYGIIHGTISDQTGGKLAAITPSFYLKNWL